jgi:hypothetical protein
VPAGWRAFMYVNKEKFDMSNTIQVSACDNELIILAYQGGVSYQVGRILSGNGQAVNVSINLLAGNYVGESLFNGINVPLGVSVNSYLPSGSYSLLFLGINWGGPSSFTASVGGTAVGGTVGQGLGLTWNPGPIAITI